MGPGRPHSERSDDRNPEYSPSGTASTSPVSPPSTISDINYTLSVVGGSVRRFPQAPPSNPNAGESRFSSSPSLSPEFISIAPRWSLSTSPSSLLRCSSTSLRSSSWGREGLLVDRCHPATRQMVKIRRLRFELSMMTAIRTTGHTCG